MSHEGAGEVVADSSVARLARIADELRALASAGLHYAQREDRRYDLERYGHVQRLAADAMSLVMRVQPTELARQFRAQAFTASPLVGAEGAVIGEDGRMLLIRREDDRRWAMPGGLLEVGEAAAEGACREVAEETGVECRAVGLVGVYDNRRQKRHGPFHLLHLTFLCQALDPMVEPQVMPECIDVGWFAHDDLPPLSSGHEVRIPDAFAFHAGRRPTEHDG